MGIIHRLDSTQTHKIAAGQVVERPACIIKELIENALDAQATIITIHIKQGGKELISVSDNGKGMDQEDSNLCFERHATSKIKHFEDIARTTTFGFRGEALAALASVSQVKLTSRQIDQPYGYTISMRYNQCIDSRHCDAPYGTTVIVTDLFGNVPVRLKFLKSEDTEKKVITTLVEGFCLAYPTIYFKYFYDDVLYLSAPATTTLKNRLIQIIDKSFIGHMIPLQEFNTTYESIQGVISGQQIGYYNKNNMFFLVNNRLVKNTSLSAAVIRGYSNVLASNKYPLCLIAVHMDPYEIDINIDPAKRQVRFAYPHRLEALISKAVQHTLSSISRHASIENQYFNSPKTPLAHSYQQSLLNDITPTQSEHQNLGVLPDDIFSTTSSQERTYADLVSHHNQQIAQSSIYEQKAERGVVFLGQIHATYLLYATAQGLTILDQHAAHECIMFKMFEQTLLDAPHTLLAFPVFINFTHSFASKAAITLLGYYGIILESISPHQAIVRQLPTHLNNSDIQDIVDYTLNIIDKYDGTIIDDIEIRSKINKALQAQLACKAAIKAGESITEQHAQKLYYDLMNLEHNISCPHGRPTRWLVDKPHLEKIFKRKK